MGKYCKGVSKDEVAEYIFEGHPSGKILRGDPILWDLLKERFQYSSISNIEQFEFESFLRNTFKDITGRGLKQGEEYYVKALDLGVGGLSAGFVCCDYWIEKGFPRLLKRYQELINILKR